MVFLPREAAAASLVRRCCLLLLALYALCNAELHADTARCAPRVRAPRPVPVAASGEITVGTQNFMRFFDDVDDGDGRPVSTAEYRLRLGKLSRQVTEVLRHPDVLAVQEVENEKVLSAFAAALAPAPAGWRYRAIAPEGFDYSGIDVGFLLRSDWTVLATEQLFRRRRLKRRALFDRPPLLLRVRTPQGVELDIVNLHLKSLYGSDREASEARRIAYKRKRQALVLQGWLQERLQREPGRPLLVLGDLNATPGALGGVDVLGLLRASGLTGLDERLPAAERYTYVYKCQGEALDHVLVSAALLPSVRRVAVSRGNAGAGGPARERADSPLRSSDHDGLVVYLGL